MPRDEERIEIVEGQAGGSSFWQFSLRTYLATGVEAACLELQDASGADIDVLLYLSWLGANGRRVGDADVADLLALVASWRSEIVVPLRNMRRLLRSVQAGFDPAGAARLRSDIKKAELQAERLQLDALDNHRMLEEIGAQAEPAEAAIENAEVYARALSVAFPQRALACVIGAALANLSGTEI